MTQEEKKTLRTPCEIYARCVGYIRPIDGFNDGKKEEFKDRKMFKLGEKNENLKEGSV